jgi:hypothetical protein
MAARETRRLADLGGGCLRAVTHFTPSGPHPQIKENSPEPIIPDNPDQEFPQLSGSPNGQGCGIPLC